MPLDDTRRTLGISLLAIGTALLVVLQVVILPDIFAPQPGVAPVPVAEVTTEGVATLDMAAVEAPEVAIPEARPRPKPVVEEAKPEPPPESVVEAKPKPAPETEPVIEARPKPKPAPVVVEAGPKPVVAKAPVRPAGVAQTFAVEAPSASSKPQLAARIHYPPGVVKPSDASVVEALYKRWSKQAPRRILLRCYADRMGDAAYNAHLTNRRCRIVWRQLRTLGVPRGVVRLYAYGEARTRGPDHTSRAHFRRVDVWFAEPLRGPQAGVRTASAAAVE